MFRTFLIQKNEIIGASIILGQQVCLFFSPDFGHFLNENRMWMNVDA